MARLRGQGGFTVIEMLVAALLMVIAMVGLYQLLDASNLMAKEETEVSEAQQSARIGVFGLARIVRQARVGALYYGNAILPISNNTAGGTSLPDLSGNAHYIRQGTDVLEVRGILLGDKYILDTGDVSCGGACDTTTQITVTIPATTAIGYVNYPTGGLPALASKTRSFYFVVQDGSNQVVTVGGSSYLVPLYAVGVVDTTGSWYTQTTSTFTFKMNPQDAGAKKLNATATLAPALAKPASGGAVDVIRFFVDEGASDATGTRADTHPALAQATLDAATGRYDIQPLVEEAEDFQIAYGVDGIDGSTRDGGVSPVKIDETGVNKDEWVGNVATEVETTLPISSTDPKHVDAFLDTSVPAGPSSPALAAPVLHSVWISLVVKSSDPDLVYHGQGARGLKILDSTAVSFSDPSSEGQPYRRRALSFAVSLRNYE
jgi:Tfp pilus assembly protein PilV